MASNLKIIRMFLEANELGKSSQRKTINKTDFLMYRVFPTTHDMILSYPERFLYILKSFPQSCELRLFGIPKSIKIDDPNEFKKSEDLELILKYGRGITDEDIIQTIREEHKIELSIKDFESILT